MDFISPRLLRRLRWPAPTRAPLTNGRFRNWAGNQQRPVGHIACPGSETEIVALVRRARERGRRLKVVGAGHSWSDVACVDQPGDTAVTLDHYARVLDVDPTTHQITVQAGIRLAHLCAELRRHHMALSNLGSVSEQSIAGAISTGTHGSGLRFGNLATQVVALRLVTGTGEVLELERRRGDDTFRAACVGVGALGIISTVTLQAEPAFDLEEVTRSVAFDQAFADTRAGQQWLEQTLHAHEHVKLWWLPHTDALHLYLANRTRRAVTRRTLARRFEESIASRAVFAALLRVGAAVPDAVPAINRLVQRAHFVPIERVARCEHVFNVPQVPVHREMEFAVDLERAAEALLAVRQLIERERLRVNFIVEARFVAADDLLLSADHGRDSCHIGAYMFASRDLPAYFRQFEALMLELGGRPHWGKEFTSARAQLEPHLPGLSRFDEVRRALDPDRVFVNEFTRRVFEAR